MDVAARHRLPLLVLALALYGAIFGGFLLVERPGLGLGHFYYVPIALLAFVGGPYAGAAGAVLATALYDLGVMVNPNIPSILPVEQTLIRLTTFGLLGVVVGVLARSNRELVEELGKLANRDRLTGLPNTRAFEAAIEQRLQRATPFTLLVGDVDELRRLNDLGRDGGDEALRRLADRLRGARRAEDEIARIGGDEFAVLSAAEGERGRSLAVSLERDLALDGDSVTFGWATFPDDGESALALYRAADERLYARKVSRGYRRDIELSTA